MNLRSKPKTEQHKLNIGKSNKGKHLGTSKGKIILKEDKKYCSKCGLWKLFTEYGKRPERPIGLRPACKKCSSKNRKTDTENYKYSQYKSGAKKRGIEFNLNIDEFKNLWQQPCIYCGDDIKTIGIDRINSNLGYFRDNVVACCTICNTMKLALPRSLFIEHCNKVTKHSED